MSHHTITIWAIRILLGAILLISIFGTSDKADKEKHLGLIAILSAIGFALTNI
jgi:hypothetical protein